MLDRRFLDYFIRTPAFRTKSRPGFHELRRHQTGDVLGYQIPLPPLGEQRRIVARIEELAKHIEEARGLRRHATEQAHALLGAARREAILGCPARTVSLDSVCSAVIDNLHSNPRLSDTGDPVFGRLMWATGHSTYRRPADQRGGIPTAHDSR